MRVRVENMRRENLNKRGRHGWKVDFVVPNATKGTIIYQNVHVSIKSSDGAEQKYSFTEAWPYQPSKKTSDSFLVPVEWREGTKGKLKVAAIVWALPGPMDPSLKKGTNDDYWGTAVHGSFNMIKPVGPPTAKTTKRKVAIEWDNRGKTAKSTFMSGKDLTLTRDDITDNI